MSHLRIISYLVLTVVLFVSCSKEPEIKPVEPEKVLTLQFKEKTVSSTINTFKLSVQANCSWKIQNSSDWISIEPFRDTCKFPCENLI